MLNTFKSESININKYLQVQKASSSERIIYWTIVLTPLWWILGIQTILYPVTATYLLLANFKLEKITKGFIPLCIWIWLGMTIAALFTNILGLEKAGFNIMKTAATLFTLFKGYFMIFACLMIPFWHRVRVKVITRAVCWMTISYLVILAIQLLILISMGSQEPFLPPLARLIPGDKLSLMVKFAVIQPFFGIPLPRTDLYTADPPILGVCSLLCFFICLGETNPRIRKFALLGSLAGLIISQSRLAWICFPFAFLVIGCFRSNLARQSFLWIASFTSLCSAFLSLAIHDLIAQPLVIFNSARADSSKDREYVISATIDAWKELPWFGWGIIGKTVTWGNGFFELPLGTFSSYAQVLYLHGLFGFLIFISALISTIYIFWQPAMTGNLICQRAFASLLALYVLCQATTLTWMAIYFWFFFIWLGAIMKEVYSQNMSIDKWEGLSI